MLNPNWAPTWEYVAMPLGSSSDAPVISPGPRMLSSTRDFPGPRTWVPTAVSSSPFIRLRDSTKGNGIKFQTIQVGLLSDCALVVVMLVLVATVAIPVVVPMAMMVPVVMLMMPTIMIPMSMAALDTMHYATGDALAWIPLPQGRCASRQHDSGGGGKKDDLLVHSDLLLTIELFLRKRVG